MYDVTQDFVQVFEGNYAMADLMASPASGWLLLSFSPLRLVKYLTHPRPPPHSCVDVISIEARCELT